jgi:hypothetical protein
MQKSGDRRAPAASDAQEHEKTHEKAKKTRARSARSALRARVFFAFVSRGGIPATKEQP